MPYLTRLTYPRKPSGLVCPVHRRVALHRASASTCPVRMSVSLRVSWRNREVRTRESCSQSGSWIQIKLILIFVWCRVDDLVEIVVVLLVIRIQHLVYPLTLYSKYDVIKKEGFHIHISLCTLNNSLYNTITSPKTGNNVSEFTSTQTGLRRLILPSPKHKESPS